MSEGVAAGAYGMALMSSAKYGPILPFGFGLGRSHVVRLMLLKR
jgi:hypothetical protein